MRQQSIQRKDKKPPVTVIDARSRPAPGVAVRTVMYVETGHLSPEQVQQLALQFAREYTGAVHGPHYFVPVRYGRLRTDVQFEHEFLHTVRQLCEVQDGEIRLRGGAHEVRVSRIEIDPTQEDGDGTD